MFNIVTWVNGITVGILFGIFPAWWLCAAFIKEKSVYRRYFPKWLIECFDWNPGFGFFQIILNNKKYYPLMLRIAAIAWVVVCIGGYHIGAWNNYKNDIIQIVEIETSLTFFLLLTSFLPIYLIKRFLNNKTKKNKIQDEIDSVPIHLVNKNQIYQQIIVITISLTTICVLFFTSNINVTIGVVISVAAIICILVFIYVRLIRKSNSAK